MPSGKAEVDRRNLGHVTPTLDLRTLHELICERFTLAAHKDPLQIVEVGTWTGQLALSLASRFDVIVHCIDHFAGNAEDHTGSIVEIVGGPGEVKAQFCRNTRKFLGGRIRLWEGTSEFWAQHWPFQVDMVFLDGNHTYEGVRRDIEIWWPHIKYRGLLSGHDYSPQFPGVIQAVGELVGADHRQRVWWRRKSEPAQQLDSIRRTGAPGAVA